MSVQSRMSTHEHADMNMLTWVVDECNMLDYDGGDAAVIEL